MHVHGHVLSQAQGQASSLREGVAPRGIMYYDVSDL